MMACSAHTLRSSFEPSHLLFVLYTFVAGLDKVYKSRYESRARRYAPALYVLRATSLRFHFQCCC